MKLELGEERSAERLSVAFRYENGMERISVRLTDGAEWHDETLDLQVARRHRQWTLLLTGREKGFAQIRVERRAEEERNVAWEQPFTLAPHEVVLAPDGTRISVSQIGATRAALLVDTDPVDIGEGRFGRWRDCLIRRAPKGDGELTLSRATETCPLVYGEPLKLSLGETAVHDDGTRLYAVSVRRVYSHRHNLDVEMTRGRLRRGQMLTPNEPGRFFLSERYRLTFSGYEGGRVALLPEKEEALPVAGPSFRLTRRPVLFEGLIVSYDDDSHKHWIAPDGGPGGTTGYYHLSIGPPGDPTPLTIEHKASQTRWENKVITVRSWSDEGLLIEITDVPTEPPPAPRRPWWRFWS
jgi:hypothetical protein